MPDSGTMEAEMLDLIALHGRESIYKLDFFIGGKDWWLFLNDYAFNEKKTVVETRTSGCRKTWCCSDMS